MQPEIRPTAWLKIFICALALLALWSPPAFASTCSNLSAGTATTLDSSIFAQDTCFNVTGSNVLLDCAGFSITGSDTTSSTRFGVRAINVSNVTLANCFISNFTGGIRLEGGISGINANVSNNTILNSVVSNSTANGIELSAMASGSGTMAQAFIFNNVFSNVTVYNNNASGIVLNATSATTSTTGTSQAYLRLNNFTNVYVANNSLYGIVLSANSTMPETVTATFENSQANITDNLFSTVTSMNNSLSGILLNSTSRTANSGSTTYRGNSTSNISMNTFVNVNAANNSGSGINLFSNGITTATAGTPPNSPNATITRNTFANVNVSNSGQYGILLNATISGGAATAMRWAGVQDNNFTNITASSNALSGIMLEADATTWAGVYGNSFDAVTASSNAANGIHLLAASINLTNMTYNYFSAITANSNSRHGIILQSQLSSSSTPPYAAFIFNNTFSNVGASSNAMDGIYLNASATSTSVATVSAYISSNWFSGVTASMNTRNGIELFSNASDAHSATSVLQYALSNVTLNIFINLTVINNTNHGILINATSKTFNSAGASFSGNTSTNVSLNNFTAILAYNNSGSGIYIYALAASSGSLGTPPNNANSTIGYNFLQTINVSNSGQNGIFFNATGSGGAVSWSTSEVIYNLLTNISAKGAAVNGLYIYSGEGTFSGTHFNTIANLSASSATQNGIVLFSTGANYSNVSRNIINNVSANSAGANGLLLQAADALTPSVSGNTVTNVSASSTGQDGIVLYSEAANSGATPAIASVSNNVIANASTSSNAGYGILLNSSSVKTAAADTQAYITSNTLANITASYNRLSGIGLELNASDAHAATSVIQYAMSNATSNLFLNLTVINNTAYGILLNSSARTANSAGGSYTGNVSTNISSNSMFNIMAYNNSGSGLMIFALTATSSTGAPPIHPNASISGNFIANFNASNSGQNGIYFNVSMGASGAATALRTMVIETNNLTNISVTNSSQNGILFAAGNANSILSAVQWNNLTNITASNSLGNCIYLLASAVNFSNVTSNRIAGAGASNCFANGILLESSTPTSSKAFVNAEVSGNTLVDIGASNNSLNGVLLNSTSSTTSTNSHAFSGLLSNTFTNVTASMNAISGIALSSNTSDVSSDASGILIYAHSNITSNAFNNVTATNNTVNGISLSSRTFVDATQTGTYTGNSTTNISLNTFNNVNAYNNSGSAFYLLALATSGATAGTPVHPPNATITSNTFTLVNASNSGQDAFNWNATALGIGSAATRTAIIAFNSILHSSATGAARTSIYLYTNGSDGFIANNTMTNTTVNRNSIIIKGRADSLANEPALELSWYLDIYVNESSGSPLASASVNITNFSLPGPAMFNGTTGADGFLTPRMQNVTELWANGTFISNGTNQTNITYFTPHNITTTKANYFPNTTLFNINGTMQANITLKPVPPPAFSEVASNGTCSGMQANFSALWQDTGGFLGWFILESNNSGTLRNETPVYMGGAGSVTSNYSNTTLTLNSTVNYQIAWRIYANDSAGNFNNSMAYQSITTVDCRTPLFFNITWNNSVGGRPTLFSANWTDDYQLAYFIFESNNSGTLKNETPVQFGIAGTTLNYSNITIQLNDSPGYIFGWKIYANDSYGNMNNSMAVQTFTILDVKPPLFFNVTGNNTQTGILTGAGANWTDQVQLGHYVFETNNSGTWTNTTVYMGGVGVGVVMNNSNQTFALNRTHGTLVAWKFDANDSAGNLNNTMALQLLTSNDTLAPTFSGVSANGSKAGGDVLVQASWADNGYLAYYIFETNLSGSWQNTTVYMGGTGTTTSNTSQQTITLPGSTGVLVGWKFDANDSRAGNFNNSMGVQVITTSNVNPPSVASLCANQTYQLQNSNITIIASANLETSANDSLTNLTITSPGGTAYALQPIASYNDTVNWRYLLNFTRNLDEAGTWTIYFQMTDITAQSGAKTVNAYTGAAGVPGTIGIGTTNITLKDVCTGGVIAHGITSLPSVPAGRYNVTAKAGTPLTLNFANISVSTDPAMLVNYSDLSDDIVPPPDNNTRRVDVFAMASNQSLDGTGSGNVTIVYNFSLINGSMAVPESVRMYKCASVDSCTYTNLSGFVNQTASTLTFNTTSFSVFLLGENKTSQTITVTETVTTTVTETSKKYIEVPVEKIVEKEVPVDRELLAILNVNLPPVVDAYNGEPVEVPVVLSNLGNVTLNDIVLSLVSNESRANLSLASDTVQTLDPQGIYQTSFTLGTPGDLTNGFEVTLNLQVGNPSINQQSKVLVQMRDRNADNRTAAESDLSFAEALFQSNAECLELSEVLDRAKLELDSKNYSGANELVQQGITGCRELMSIRGVQQGERAGGGLLPQQNIMQNPLLLAAAIVLILSGAVVGTFMLMRMFGYKRH